MKHLTLAVVALLMLSVNSVTVGCTEPSAVAPGQRVKSKRARIDYSQFRHRTHVDNQKLACDSCHRFPTDNWKDVRAGDAAFPDVTEFPKHETCLNCHRQQFFARQRPAPAICSNCHVKVSPRDTARFLFPSLGDVMNHSAPKKSNIAELKVEFPHEKHEDQECVACHQLDKEGEVKSKPNSHTVCFTCHNLEAELPPMPPTCNGCHKMESLSLPQKSTKSSKTRQNLFEPFVLLRGKNLAHADQKMTVRDDADYSKFQHASAYHKRLPCALCHRRETNAAQPTMPGGKDHLPCAGCHTKQFADRSNAICTNCHTEPSTGALKPFPTLTSFKMKFDHARHTGTACSNCHRPARAGVALTIPAGFNAHTTCFQCHGPQAKSGDRDISSCGVCHELGNYARPTQTARAFRVGFSHAQHNSDERLSCNVCHRVQTNDVTAPQPLNHHAARGSFSCMSCHNGKRAFGGDDFSVCTRCHKGSVWHF